MTFEFRHQIQMGTGLGGEGVVGVVGENSYSNAESAPLVKAKVYFTF